MKILNEINSVNFDILENNDMYQSIIAQEAKDVEKNTIKFKKILNEGLKKEIRENMFLIIFSLIPIIMYSLCNCLVNEELNFCKEFFLNPDLMLLPIAYIMHCVFSIADAQSSRDSHKDKLYIGYIIVVVIAALFFYIILKMSLIESNTSIAIIIWSDIIITIVFSIHGSIEFLN